MNDRLLTDLLFVSCFGYHQLKSRDSSCSMLLHMIWKQSQNLQNSRSLYKPETIYEGRNNCFEDSSQKQNISFHRSIYCIQCFMSHVDHFSRRFNNPQDVNNPTLGFKELGWGLIFHLATLKLLLFCFLDLVAIFFFS